MRAALLALPLAWIGCGKELNPKFCAAHPDDERCTGVDAPDAAIDADESTFPVAHLSPSIEAMLTSDADVVLDINSAATVIDTTNGTITPSWPGAIILADVPQEDGPNVMVVQVGSLTIQADANYVEVDGARPLIIVATRTMSIDARINVSADLDVAGPGGFASAQGPGAGGAGSSSGATGDGGGGGGSFATRGGAGGDPSGGSPGSRYGAASRLTGGSGGGRASGPSCTVEGGAGGGAIQLTALVSISFVSSTGRINAGGSGGIGGQTCAVHGSGGGGGGSGGMIFLESPLITGDGHLGALGGGGGEGASSTGTVGAAGGDASTDTAGVGGSGLASDGGDGGGGAQADDGTPGADASSTSNGGGGGGGAGHIFIDTSGPAPASIVSNPPATVL